MQAFDLKAAASIWPCLSYMCHVCSTFDPRRAVVISWPRKQRNHVMGAADYVVRSFLAVESNSTQVRSYALIRPYDRGARAYSLLEGQVRRFGCAGIYCWPLNIRCCPPPLDLPP